MKSSRQVKLKNHKSVNVMLIECNRLDRFDKLGFINSLSILSIVTVGNTSRREVFLGPFRQDICVKNIVSKKTPRLCPRSKCKKNLQS